MCEFSIGMKITVISTPALKGKIGVITDVFKKEQVFKAAFTIGHKTLTTLFHFNDNGQIYTIVG